MDTLSCYSMNSAIDGNVALVAEPPTQRMLARLIEAAARFQSGEQKIALVPGRPEFCYRIRFMGTNAMISVGAKADAEPSLMGIVSWGDVVSAETAYRVLFSEYLRRMLSDDTATHYLDGHAPVMPEVIPFAMELTLPAIERHIPAGAPRPGWFRKFFQMAAFAVIESSRVSS
jgi:hypothetical protein